MITLRHKETHKEVFWRGQGWYEKNSDVHTSTLRPDHASSLASTILAEDLYPVMPENMTSPLPGCISIDEADKITNADRHTFKCKNQWFLLFPSTLRDGSGRYDGIQIGLICKSSSAVHFLFACKSAENLGRIIQVLNGDE